MIESTPGIRCGFPECCDQRCRSHHRLQSICRRPSREIGGRSSDRKMTDSTCQLITFGPEHLEGAVRLSQQAKWPHRLDDWRMALELSKGLVAVAANGTSIIGTILVTPYKENVATINMVVVDEMARGRGLGRRLWDAAMPLAGSRALRLIAPRDGLPLYEKLGF